MIVVLAACNRYTLFHVETLPQDDFSNRADVLFVIDNSDSMLDETRALAENFGTFVDLVAGRDAQHGTDGLADLAARSIDEMGDRAAFADFQIAVTTTDASGNRGAGIGSPAIVPRETANLSRAFLENLLCGATCIGSPAALPEDPGTPCGGAPDPLSRDYLDCLCGPGEWTGHCGSGREEPIEAVFLAMCRAAEDPPSACFDDPSVFTAADVGTLSGFLRDDSTLIPVIVTDEGDDSRRSAQADALPRPYETLFEEFGFPMVWAVVGPTLEADSTVACGGIATPWGVYRLDALVTSSGGLKVPIHAPDCGPADFTDALDRLGELVVGLRSKFALPQAAEPDSIRVAVGGESVPPAFEEKRDAFGQIVWSDGWTYDEEDAVVQLHGSAIPEARMDIAIWYLPDGS